eukprot:scaffold10700_cov108-Isochrysis_galbana.AAC.2
MAPTSSRSPSPTSQPGHRIMKTKLKKNLGASALRPWREKAAPRLRPGFDGGWTDDTPEAPIAANVEQLGAAALHNNLTYDSATLQCCPPHRIDSSSPLPSSPPPSPDTRHDLVFGTRLRNP